MDAMDPLSPAALAFGPWAWGPTPYVVLDIETGEADEAEIQAACERWEPPSNIKDQGKIDDRRVEAYRKIRERSALLDGAPIIVISARSSSECRLFHGLGHAPMEVPGFQVDSLGDERGMLEGFRKWLDTITGPESYLVGHNILSFDLPKLRRRYVHHRLPIPSILVPRLDEVPPVDTMRLFLRYFSAELHGEKIMISLGEVTERMGLPQYKTTVSGAEIPGLAKAGRVREVLTYGALDCLATWEIFQLMLNLRHGRAPADTACTTELVQP